MTVTGHINTILQIAYLHIEQTLMFVIPAKAGIYLFCTIFEDGCPIKHTSALLSIKLGHDEFEAF